jgi:hypothetical protein
MPRIVPCYFQANTYSLTDFNPIHVMADSDEASAAAFVDVFDENITVCGCWFHYAQSIIKRVQNVGLQEAYLNEHYVQATVHHLLSLPPLPAGEIFAGVDDVCLAITSDSQVF